MVTNNVYLDEARLTVQVKVADALTETAKTWAEAAHEPGMSAEEKSEALRQALMCAAAAGMLAGIAEQARKWEASHTNPTSGDNLTSLDV